jgi:protein TonB
MAAAVAPAVSTAPAPAPVAPAVEQTPIAPAKAVKKPAPVPTPKPVALKANSKAAKQSRTVASKQPAVTHAAPEPVAAPAPQPVAPPPPPPPAPEPVEAPSGPFFEAGQVTEQPRVSSQVPLNVPDVFKGRTMNDVVILRVLVSQSGRASNVTMLRRSKAGPGLDEAVVASVKQWRFSPARRKGETVSCWFNVGVPLSKLE